MTAWHSSDNHGTRGWRYFPPSLAINARWIYNEKLSIASWSNWKSFTDPCITAVDLKGFQSLCSSCHLFTPLVGIPFTFYKRIGKWSLPWLAKWNPTVHQVNQLTYQYWKMFQFEFGSVCVCHCSEILHLLLTARTPRLFLEGCTKCLPRGDACYWILSRLKMDGATAQVDLSNHLCRNYVEESKWMQQCKIIPNLSCSVGGWPRREYPDILLLLLHEVHYEKPHIWLVSGIFLGKSDVFPSS